MHCPVVSHDSTRFPWVSLLQFALCMEQEKQCRKENWMSLAPFSPSWCIPPNYKMLDNVKTRHTFPTLTTQSWWIQTYTGSSLSSRPKHYRGGAKYKTKENEGCSSKVQIAAMWPTKDQSGISHAEGQKDPSHLCHAPLPHKINRVSLVSLQQSFLPSSFT